MSFKNFALGLLTVSSLAACGKNEAATSQTKANYPTGEHHYTLVISRTTNRLTVYSAATHKPVPGWIGIRVITGAGYATPSGTYYIEDKEKCPTWSHPALGYAGPCAPDNPLGRRWIQWNTMAYGIHGNSAEYLFDLPDNERRLSHGCIRMKNADVERLYEFVGRGDKVIID